MGFVNVVNFVEVELFCLYINSFTKILKVTISHNATGVMVTHLDLNLVFKLWTKIGFSIILNRKLNEYVKLVDTWMVQMLGFVEDERMFINLSFMKNKL
jgi:hypothetical protein